MGLLLGVLLRSHHAALLCRRKRTNRPEVASAVAKPKKNASTKLALSY